MILFRSIQPFVLFVALSYSSVAASTGDIKGGFGAMNLEFDNKSEFGVNFLLGLANPVLGYDEPDTGIFWFTVAGGLPISYLPNDHGPSRFAVPGIVAIGTGMVLVIPMATAMTFTKQSDPVMYGIGVAAIAALCTQALTDADITIGSKWASLYGTHRFDLLWPGWYPRDRLSTGVQIGVPDTYLRVGVFQAFSTLAEYSKSGYEFRLMLCR